MIGLGIVAYIFFMVATGFYLDKVGDARRWSSYDTGFAQFFGGALWPLAWLIMFAWWVSTKIGVPGGR